ncbi:MAG: 6-bladed beta-propeller [Candidatus Nitrotoga sp.]
MTLVLLSGCSSNKVPDVLDFGTGPGVTSEGKREVRNVIWPPLESGEVPRFKYAGELYGEENFRPANQANLSVVQHMMAALRWLIGLTAGESTPITLQRPQAGVVDVEGRRILVTDVSRQAVYVFDQVAGRLDIWNNATAQKTFITPTGIVMGMANDVYVADADLAYVTQLNLRGESVAIIGEGQLVRPTGLAFDRVKQLLYVADTHDHNIKVFDVSQNNTSDAAGEKNSTLLRTIGRKGEKLGEFNSPTYMALDKGELFVTDTLNARVQVLDAETGIAKRVIGKRGNNVGNLVRPKGVAVDSDGNVYVVESYHDHLLVFNREGEFLIPIGGTGEGIGQFYLPASVWVDSNDQVFVADMFNGRVALLQYLKAPDTQKSLLDSSASTMPVADTSLSDLPVRAN